MRLCDHQHDRRAGYQHRVSERDKERALASAESRGLSLSGEQRDAFDHATDGKDLGVVIGYAGTGKSAMLGVVREAWEQAGYQVRGAALSGIAAEGLEAGSAIPSRTIASLEHQWSQGREMLTDRDVLVIDEAGMIGSRQMERVSSHSNEAGAKVVLVGDPDQSRIILTHTNDEVRALNDAARGKLRDAGQLGDDIAINTERGDRQFATGDRLMFLRNDRDLGVKNGILGEVEKVNPQSMTVKLDDGRSIAFDTTNYSHIDYGYAATIHKSQGVTVDRTHVLATPGLDRHPCRT